MPKLIVREGGGSREIALGSHVTIGRQPDNEVVLADAGSSRRHAAIVLEDKCYYLQDLGSANGTRVNGVRVSRHLLAFGDVVQIGEASLLFAEDEPQSDPAYAATVMGMPAFVAPAAPAPNPLVHPEPAAPAVPAEARPAAPAPVPLVNPEPAVAATAPRGPAESPAARLAAPEPAPLATPAPAAPQRASALDSPRPTAAPPTFAYAGFWAARRRDPHRRDPARHPALRASARRLRAARRRCRAPALRGRNLGLPIRHHAPLLRALGVVGERRDARQAHPRHPRRGRVGTAGRRVGFGKALARNLGKILSGAVCGLGYLFAAFTLRKCAWHDSLAGCLVVKAACVPASASAAGACRGCGASSRPGLAFCTQCGRRLA